MTAANWNGGEMLECSTKQVIIMYCGAQLWKALHATVAPGRFVVAEQIYPSGGSLCSGRHLPAKPDLSREPWDYFLSKISSLWAKLIQAYCIPHPLKPKLDLAIFSKTGREKSASVCHPHGSFPG